MYRRIFWFLFIVGVFVPRLVVPDDFFIQDEQPWIDRSQLYVDALFSGDFAAAVRYPLSNHPAVSLMTTIGPIMNLYGSYHGLDGTYATWSLDDKRDAAVWARYIWGIVCSSALLLLYGVVSHLRIFAGTRWAAGLVVVLFGLEPWVWGISRSVSVDVMMAIGVVGMLLSAVVAFEKRSSMWIIASGAWFALAFVSKSPVLITAPIALLLASIIPTLSPRIFLGRALIWFVSAYSTTIFLWPPFLLHPIERLTDILARAELHSTVQEIYQWPGIHPPLFVFTLSAFATIGCALYLWNRISDIRKYGWHFFALDIVLLAGIWHGIILVYLHGDHARKNLPILAILGFIGALGWVWVCVRHHVPKIITIVGICILQGIFVWPYFPHVISSYNVLFPSIEGKRLLVDVGTGSRLIADYINSKSPQEVFSTSMDSLVLPYLDVDMRKNLRALPADGKLAILDPAVTQVIIPMSFPARVLFDPIAQTLVREIADMAPIAVLSVRDVPLFLVYSVNHE